MQALLEDARTSPESASLTRMKLASVVAMVVAAGLVVLQAEPQAPTDSRASELIHVLNLHVLPKESGYLGVIGRSAQTVTSGGRTLAVQSQNYYMLTHDRPINYLHWLASDDTHILIEGGPVDYFIFLPDGHAEKVILGRDVEAGQKPVVAVPGNCWKALRLEDGVRYALMANTLSPEFTADRVRIGAGDDWVNRYTGSASWATPQVLRELIGPNWVAK